MNKSMFLVAVFVVTCFLLAGVSFSESQVTAMRELPEYVLQDEVFQVRISVDIDEENKPSSYILSEKIPEGFVLQEIVPPYNDFDEDERIIKWIVIEGFDGKTVEDMVYTYKLQTSSCGTYAFNGVVKTADEPVTVGGNVVVKVRDNCSEDWVCGYWSECVDGIQTRECRDANSCLFSENQPDTSRSCTVEEQEETVEEEEEVASSGGGSHGPVVVATNETAVEAEEEAEEQVNQSAQEEEVAEEEQVEEEGEIAGEEVTDQRAGAEGEQDYQNDSLISEEGQSDAESFDEEPVQDTGNMPLHTMGLSIIMIAGLVLLAIKRYRH